MTRFLLPCLFFLVLSPAMAAYKCETGKSISYSDTPCPGGKQLTTDSTAINPTDVAQAKQRAEREKQELTTLEHARHQREASEEKEQKKTAKKIADKKKKCAALAQKRQWSEEDAARASVKSEAKAKRKARRAAEKYEMECGK